MSALAAVLHIDGRAVDSLDIERMAEALTHRGPDGARTWCEGPVGLAHLMLHVTPESLREVMPMRRRSGGPVLTADAWLDDRGDLAARVGLADRPRGEVTDGDLFLAAYELWGDRCPEHIEGAYSALIWDALQRTLLCITDPLGLRPLYYHHDARRFAVATEIKGVLALAGVPRLPNHRKLAQLGLPLGVLLEKEETFFQGIRKVPPATVMKVGPAGVEFRRYWAPDPDARLDFRSNEEGLEAFRQHFFRSVAARTRSAFPVAALLSGGLDSSAIVSVAARQLAQRGAGLTTLSAVIGTDAPPDARDERAYIDLFRDAEGIDQAYVTDPWRGPFDDIERLVWCAEGPATTSRHYLYTAFAEATHRRGARVLLDGMGGEFGPSYGGQGYLAELLVHGRWRTLGREARLMAGRGGGSFLRLLAREALVPLLPRPALAMFGATRLAGRDPLETPPLRSAWVADVLGSDLEALIRRGQSTVSPDHRQNQRRMFHMAWGAAAGTGFVGHEKVRMEYPFADRRLIEFCLALPGHFKVYNGYRRYLIRAGLEGYLPREIQWRTTNEPFSPDYAGRFNRDRSQAQALLDAIPPNDPVREIIDIPRLEGYARHEMSSYRVRTAADAGALQYLPLGVNLLAFHRTFQREPSK